MTAKFSLKSLSAQDARLALSMYAFTRDELGVDLRGSSLLIAFSGGADSTALLALCAALREELGLCLHAAHLDHGLREESGKDAQAASAVCQSLDVPCVHQQLDIAALSRLSSRGLEEEGRVQRYAFLEETRQQIGAEWILTAHHADDLAEDIFLRLIRGTSWPGLGGMPGKRGLILRPLLMMEKNTLVDFLVREHIPWQEDSSNADMHYTRNRVRHQLLPFVLQENPAFHEVARSLWQMAQIDAAFWDQMVQDTMQDISSGPSAISPHTIIFLPYSVLQELPKAARMRAYAGAIRSLNSGQPRASTLFALDRVIAAKKHDKCLQFPGNVQAQVEKEGVRFCTRHKTDPRIPTAGDSHD